MKQDNVSLPLAAPDQESQPEAEQPSERPPEQKPETEEFSEFIPGTTCKLDLTRFSLFTFTLHFPSLFLYKTCFGWTFFPRGNLLTLPLQLWPMTSMDRLTTSSSLVLAAWVLSPSSNNVSMLPSWPKWGHMFSFHLSTVQGVGVEETVLVP